jgi:hypothetical protein
MQWSKYAQVETVWRAVSSGRCWTFSFRHFACPVASASPNLMRFARPAASPSRSSRAPAATNAARHSKPIPAAKRCAAHVTPNPMISIARALFKYDDASKALILGLKHGDRLDHLPGLGRWLTRAGDELLRSAGIIRPPFWPSSFHGNRTNRTVRCCWNEPAIHPARVRCPRPRPDAVMFCPPSEYRPERRNRFVERGFF